MPNFWRGVYHRTTGDMFHSYGLVIFSKANFINYQPVAVLDFQLSVTKSLPCLKRQKKSYKSTFQRNHPVCEVFLIHPRLLVHTNQFSAAVKASISGKVMMNIRRCWLSRPVLVTIICIYFSKCKYKTEIKKHHLIRKPSEFTVSSCYSYSQYLLLNASSLSLFPICL